MKKFLTEYHHYFKPDFIKFIISTVGPRYQHSLLLSAINYRNYVSIKLCNVTTLPSPSYKTQQTPKDFLAKKNSKLKSRPKIKLNSNPLLLTIHEKSFGDSFCLFMVQRTCSFGSRKMKPLQRGKISKNFPTRYFSEIFQVQKKSEIA